MLENILTRKNYSVRVKLTVKSIASVTLVVLAVVLPQLVHLAAGAAGGMQWLPMYLPVLIGGCALGAAWGVCIGIASPIASFLVTLAFGNPMPAAARLPFMVIELAVFAAVSGMFSSRIAKNELFAVPAVLLAQVAGRAVFVCSVAIFGSFASLTVQTVWAQVQTGLVGLLLQAALVPLIVMGIKKLSELERKQDRSE